MNQEELAKISDEELEARIADARPNSYVPSSIYHVYMAEQEKRRHQRLLDAVRIKQRNMRGKSKKKISDKIIKRLFALSGNLCAFPGCSTQLANEGIISAQIAHIEAEKPGGPRYNPKQSETERFGYDNLILLCPTHHNLIDKDSKTYTVEVLKQFKSKRESNKSDVVIEVSYNTQLRTQQLHNYELKVVVKNNSHKSINKPKLKIILPNDVIRVISSSGQKTIRGKLAEVYFDKLDLDVIHPGEEKILTPSPNIGIIYFMNSDLFDEPDMMNQLLQVELYADDFQPLKDIKDFRNMQKF